MYVYVHSSEKEPTADDVSKLLHLPQALQKNINKFVDQLLVRSTSIPDDLIAEDCLSENECEVIRDKPSPKDQARMLIRKIQNRGPLVITKFLEIVGKNHPELQQEVNSTLEKLVNEHKNKPMCVICVMKQTVDLKDIGDSLWSENIISNDVHGDIYDNPSVHNSRQIYWDHITNSVNSFEDPGVAFDILKRALEAKYKHIVEYLNQTSDKPPLSCFCCKPRRIRQRDRVLSDSGSQTEYSTTSSRIPRLPTVVYDFDDSSSVNSQKSSNLPSETLSLDVLEKFDSIDSNPLQDPHISSTNNVDVNDKKRHRSGNFVPTPNYKENNDDRHPSIPLGELFDSLQITDPDKPNINRSISYQSFSTVRPYQSTSSGYISSSDSSKQPDKPLSDLSLTPSPQFTMPGPFTPQVHNEDKSAIETAADDNDDFRKSPWLKVSAEAGGLLPESHSASQSEPKHVSRLRAQRKHSKLFLKTKPRPINNSSTTNIGVRRQNSRKSKSSDKRARRRQKKMDSDAGMIDRNVRDTEDGLKKPFNPLWRKGDLYNKTYLQPKLVPRWDYLQARRHNRIAQLTSVGNREVDNDSDFLTEDSETLTTFSNRT